MPMPSAGYRSPGAAHGSRVQRLDALPLVRCSTRPDALVMLGLPHLVAQCLARAADLPGNRVDRRPLRGVLALVVQDHPNRAGTNLRGIRGNSLRHRSILSRVGASDKPGAVRGERGQCGEVVAALASEWQCCGQADGWAAAATAEGRARMVIGADRREAGPDLAGGGGRVGRARHAGKLRRGVALFPARGYHI